MISVLDMTLIIVSLHLNDYAYKYLSAILKILKSLFWTMNQTLAIMQQNNTRYVSSRFNRISLWPVQVT